METKKLNAPVEKGKKAEFNLSKITHPKKIKDCSEILVSNSTKNKYEHLTNTQKTNQEPK